MPALGAHRVSAITESRIRPLITGLHDAGLSARRIKLTLLVLKMILRTAQRRRYLRDDPTETIKAGRGVPEPGHEYVFTGREAACWT